MNEYIVDAIKASLARVLPGALILFVGVMLMLALGITLLVESPPLVRSFASTLPQPFRSLALFVSLAVPLVALCWCGRRLLGYIMTRTIKPKEDA
jgi:hypothetical protein